MKTPWHRPFGARAGVHLIALLNKIGFSSISEQEALRLAEQLLEAGWAE